MVSIFTSRFIHSNITELQQFNRPPISNYKNVPLMSLEEAVQSITQFYDGAIDDAKKAKENCRQNSPLSINESAAIYLYTMSIKLYSLLNQALRAESRKALGPWLPFLKLLTTALEKLPPLRTTVWRGVGGITGTEFDKNTVHTWWSVNSCSLEINVGACFAGMRGTLFCIHTFSGKDITTYSWNKSEKEIVLMPGTNLLVESTSFDINGFSIVYLKEW